MGNFLVTAAVRECIGQLATRVARCPTFNRTLRYFSSLYGVKMAAVIPDNACENS